MTMLTVCRVERTSMLLTALNHRGIAVVHVMLPLMVLVSVLCLEPTSYSPIVAQTACRNRVKLTH